MTPLIVPPRRTAKGWQRYAVMILSSGLMAWCMPTETASCTACQERERQVSGCHIAPAESTRPGEDGPDRWRGGRSRESFSARGFRFVSPGEFWSSGIE